MTHEEFKEIFDRDHKKMVYFAKSFVGEFLAEDFVADAFAKLWERGEVEDANTFLGACVRNACLNHLKHLKDIKPYQRGMLYEAEKSQDYIEAKLIKTQLIGIIVKEIDASPTDRKHVMRLVKNGFTTPEISNILNISQNTVRVHIKRFKDDFGKHHRRSKIEIYFNGKSYSVKEFAVEVGISIQYLHSLLKGGWSAKEILYSFKKY